MLCSTPLSYFSICPCLCFNDVRNEIGLLWHLTRTAFDHYAFCPSFRLTGEHNDILTTLITYILEGILFLFYLHKSGPRVDNGWRSARVLKREAPSGGYGRTYKSLSDSFLTCLLWVAIQKIERQVYIGTIGAFLHLVKVLALWHVAEDVQSAYSCCDINYIVSNILIVYKSH